MNFLRTHPWVEPLLFSERAAAVPSHLVELASPTRLAAGVVGYDLANARAHEVTQYGLAQNDIAQAEFYQRLSAEGTMVMHQQQMAAHQVSAAQSHARARAEESASTGVAATLLLLLR